MLILAFDTTAAACSVALCRDGAVLAGARRVMDQGQAEALIPMIEEVMARSGLTYNDVDRIAVTVGPGSFTGVRVGLAAARGLGLAAAKPVVGVLTTEVLAAAIPQSERDATRQPPHLLAAVDTKRGDLYVQQFDATERALSDPVSLDRAGLAAWASPGPLVVVGDAAAIAVAAIGARAVLSAADPFPDAPVLARLAAKRQPQDHGPLPVYVRAPDAVMPRHGGRLRP
jgi:tRNA threonylcarbamoyladenosine biosynthesis protein TsaB